MKGNRKRDTKPEVALRALLHRAGLRFRKDYPVRPDAGRSIRVDIAFPRLRIAVFVDGCFWHGCPEHGTQPRSNASYWEPKLARNRERDQEVDARFHAAGWHVIRVWEHEELPDAARRIAATVEADATNPPNGAV
jgi:DNA mismatch endonuclease (patch repair protein)